MMKLAVISFTVNGTRLNRKLGTMLEQKLQVFRYVKSKQPQVLEEAG